MNFNKRVVDVKWLASMCSILVLSFNIISWVFSIDAPREIRVFFIFLVIELALPFAFSWQASFLYKKLYVFNYIREKEEREVKSLQHWAYQVYLNGVALLCVICFFNTLSLSPYYTIFLFSVVLLTMSGPVREGFVQFKVCSDKRSLLSVELLLPSFFEAFFSFSIFLVLLENVLSLELPRDVKVEVVVCFLTYLFFMSINVKHWLLRKKDYQSFGVFLIGICLVWTLITLQKYEFFVFLKWI